MKIAVNMKIGRPEWHPHLRKTRRMVYVAWILRDLGHQVLFHKPHGFNWSRWRTHEMYPFTRLLDDVPKVVEPLESVKVDAYFCSSHTAVAEPGTLPDGVPVVAWKETLDYTRDAQMAPRVAVSVNYVWRRQDWTESETADHRRRPPDSPGYLAAVRDKVLSVPWIPHERTLDQIDRDGLTKAYLRDDLATLRRRYAAPKPTRGLGFAGAKLPLRSRVVSKVDLDDVTYRWGGKTGQGSQTPGEYLRWLSECRAVLQLPGDTWKCSRFAETVIVGRPVVQLAGKVDLTPPLMPGNCILIESWSDQDAVDSGLSMERQVVAGADAAYREGWSLRGQVQQALRRLR